jgi:putative transposase
MGITRQGFYKRRKTATAKAVLEELLVQRVLTLRNIMPRIGGRKLYYLIKYSGMPSKLGRDKFFRILASNRLLVSPVKQYVRTTQSSHHFRVYSNLIKDLKVDRPFMVLVSDITYIRSSEGFCYLFLITDLYSRKILGYNLAKTMETKEAVKALKMALEKRPDNLPVIHHSDRGIQYCSHEYVRLLKSAAIQISMGEAGNPYENAVAERVNGILKTEFLLNTKFNSYSHAKKAAAEAIETYNKLRPHMSLNYLTPDQKHAA